MDGDGVGTRAARALKGSWTIHFAALVCALAGMAACGAAGGGSQAPARQGLAMRNVTFPLHDIRYPSGLRIIAERDERMPLVAVVLVVGAGSSSDPPGKEGLAHYVEHLAFRSKPFGKSSFRQLLERAGAGSWNAYTGLDATVYHAIVPTKALPEVLRLEGARMLATVSRIEADALSVELDVVRSELRQRNETGFAGELFGSMQALLFPPSHPYARPVIGTHGSLSTITAEDVAAFLKASYRPSNMTLALVGDVNLDSIQGLLDSTLPAELRAAPATPEKRPALPAVAPEPPAPPPSPLVRKEASVATPELWIGWSLPRGFDAESYLIGFLEDSLESAMAGVDREDGDLVDVSVSKMAGKDASMLFCRAVLRNGSDPEASMQHVLNRVHRVWQPGAGVRGAQLTEIALGRRRRSAVVSMLLEAEHLLTRADARGTITHFSGDPGIYSRAMQSVAALDSDRLTGFAQKYLTRDRSRAVFFVPPAAGSPPPTLAPISAPDVTEQDTTPIGLSADRLRAVAPTPDVRGYTQLTLPNGLHVILAKRDGLPVTSVGLLVRGGYCTKDRPGGPAAGDAAMKMARPKEKWHGEPADFGGQWESYATPQSVRFNLTGASGNTAIMIAMMAERVRSLEIDSGAWQWFQTEYVPFLRARDRKPEFISGRAFSAALFGAHPYACSPTAEDLADVSLGDARDWLSATLRPERAVLSVVGEIDVEAIKGAVSEEFGGWGKGESDLTMPEPASPRADPTTSPVAVITHRPSATQFQVTFGCILPPATKSALDVQHDVLAELVGTRLKQGLRERLGITYGVSATAWVMRGGTAFLQVKGAVEASRLGTSLGLIKETLEKLGQAPVPANELAWAKMRVARSHSGQFMANSDIVSRLLSTMNTGYSPERIEAFADELFAVAAEPLQEDARACLAGRSAVSVVGDETAARAALKQVWP